MFPGEKKRTGKIKTETALGMSDAGNPWLELSIDVKCDCMIFDKSSRFTTCLMNIHQDIFLPVR